jgi:hypothetical protein
VTLPSNATQLGAAVQFNPTGPAGSFDFFQVSFVQLELGSVATPFEQRPYGQELMLCQRYFETSIFSGACNITNSDSVLWTSGTTSTSIIFFKVTKRTTPTITESAVVINSTGTWRDAGVSNGNTGSYSTGASVISPTGSYVSKNGTYAASAEL